MNVVWTLTTCPSMQRVTDAAETGTSATGGIVTGALQYGQRSTPRTLDEAP